MSEDLAEWLSFHVRVPHSIYSADFDRVLVGVVPRVIAEMTERHAVTGTFFIRYAEGGNHIRIRLRGRHRDLVRDVPDAIRRASAKDSGRPRSELLGVSEVAYEPEILRYGGHPAIKVAESFFCQSSEMALGVVKRTLADRPDRVGTALLAMVGLVATASITRSTASQLLTDYSENVAKMVVRSHAMAEWKRTIEDHFEATADQVIHEVDAAWEHQSVDHDAEMRAYWRAAQEMFASLKSTYDAGSLTGTHGAFRSWEHCVGRIGGSQIHMTNNRLGIPPVEEAHLAAIAARALSNREAFRA
jgi:thiopeptide-type bacteriocin biosynthesis protein